MWRRKPKDANRRRRPRKPVEWAGRCVFAGATEGVACAIVDVSSGGARLLVAGGVAVREGAALRLTVDRVGQTIVSTTLSGTVRHIGPAPDGVGMGVEVTFDPSNERIARSLFGS